MSAATFFRDKSVLITGASSGIGEEMAMQLAAAGARLTLAARRREKLEALAGKIAAAAHAAPVVVECDVTRDGDLDHAVSAAVGAFGKLDVAIANAGFGVKGVLASIALEDYRRQFDTNVFGVLRTIYAALPEIRKARGNIAIVGSVAGWVASPGSSAYSMSKFALRGLVNAIGPELSRSGVKLTLLSPGFVVSEFRRVDNYARLDVQAKDPAPDWIQVPTDVAVRQMLRAIAAGKHEAVITGHGKVLVAIERFAPWLNRLLIAKFSPRARRQDA